MRFLLLAPFLFAAQAAQPPRPVPPTRFVEPAGGRFALAADAGSRWVAFDLTPGNQVRFEMLVDGRPATALLDTGVSFTILSKAFAGVDPARVRPGGNATAIGGALAVGWTPLRFLQIGALTRTGGELAVAKLPAVATGSADGVDLLVGRDLLAGHALDIDYPGKRFRLLPSGARPFAGAGAPLAVSAARRVYEGEITVNGRRIAPVVVDTGDGSAVSLPRERWRAAGLDRLRTTTAIAYGAGGAVVSELAVLPSVGLGALRTGEVEVRQEPRGGYSEAIGAAGRVGTGLLGRYRVLLDPRAGRMVLSPGPEADRPAPRSTSGLLMGILPDRARVLHVMRGGPGAAAGWKAGEEVCAVDGTPIDRSYPTSPLATWTAGEPGRVVRLRLCGGGERTLTLRRFY